jgi:hypothetical protein
MAVLLTDLLIKGSSSLATAGNATPNSGPGSNLGGFCSSGALIDATLDNLFSDATGAENAAGNQDYQCYFLLNNNGTQDLSNITVFVNGDTPGGAVIAVGLDPTGITSLASSLAQAAVIPNKNTPPAGVVFSYPVLPGNGLLVSNLTHGFVLPIWIRRTCQGGPAVNNDGVIIGYSATIPL